MNRIVREHYPVAKLPEDLKSEIGRLDTVRVILEGGTARAGSTFRDAVADLLVRRRSLAPGNDDAADRVSRLRDEWDGTNQG